MWYIVNGSVQLETDVVTGLASDPNRATPSGVYSILEMKRDKVLTGETNPSTGEPIYRTKVSFGCVSYMDWESDFMMQSGSRRLVETGIRLRRARMVVLICRWIRQLLLYDMLEMGTPVVIHE